MEHSPAAITGHQPLPAMRQAGLRPGVSLVTCCMNRNDNLLRALPSWLALPEVTEIIIVDWSSTTPVADSLAAAGFSDPRLRIARVTGEPRWVLSWAFNIGFRLAGCARILKADADIVLDPGFFAGNPLAPGQFIAGNWRTAAPGQQFINGFFLAHQADLAKIGGFNEYITTYGWDDDDLYDRLTASGTARIDVAAGSIRHLDHDDAVRIDETSDGRDGRSALQALTIWKIRSNRVLATLMPVWDNRRRPVPAHMRETAGGWQIFRSGALPHPVPPHLRQMAEQAATWEVLTWRTGQRALDLPPEMLGLLLDCLPLERITTLQVELALAGADIVALTAARHLLIRVIHRPQTGLPAQAEIETLAGLARAAGRVPVLCLPPLLAGDAVGRYGDLPVLDAGRVTETGPRITAETLGQHPEAPVLVAWLHPDAAAPQRNRPAPRRDRLWIDAQHGLGNRLRAIGSAAAIAEATGRELVVIWEPDHHCEARFEDIFAPDVPVLTRAFPAEARAEGATLLNYMEIEPDAAKGAALHLVEGRDAYIRSAYVINHPASTWDSENRFLRRLVPNAAVQALLEQVADHRDIGLHVRMEGSPGTDTNSYDSAANWTAEGHAAIHRWRSASHFSRFMTRLDQLLRQQPEARVFLAADMPAVYQAFAERYGARVTWLERTTWDRSAAQLQYALADILLLARCRQFLGSNWSSFSELVLRLSDTITHNERSGVDF